jgi:protein O-GlcNAc transferase
MYRTFKTASTAKPTNLLPTMFSKSKKEIFHRLLDQSTAYFEWGCGGSTAIASQFPNLQVMSVESDAEWANRVSEICPNATVKHCDIGPTKEFGYPTDDTKRAQWPEYAEQWLQTPLSPDVVLIDGRFRVACAALICLHPKQVKTICFDDFTDRHQYQVIRPFIQIHQTFDNMITWRPKTGVDRAALQELYDSYKFDPA